ncbi:MAG: AAA family ATPase [Zetaproteobacteria bacterium]|nr:AAA family ATPase [Zetaproteobacteria bacterium]
MSKQVKKKKVTGTLRKSTSKKLPKELPLSKVFLECKNSQIPFQNTSTLKLSNNFISQDRAVKAIHTGLGIKKPGYNVYVAGFQGTGKTSVIRNFLEQESKKVATPHDWVYIHNFDNEDHPIALKLPCGKGAELKKLMDTGLRGFTHQLREAFLSEEYEIRVNTKMSQNNELQAQHYTKLEKLARKCNFQIKSSQIGIETIPIVDGRTVTEKEYGKLPEAQRTQIEKERSKIEPKILDFARKVRQIDIDTKDFVVELQQSILVEIINKLLDPIRKKFKEIPKVLEWCDQIQNYASDNMYDFIEPEMPSGEDDTPSYMLQMNSDSRDPTRKFRVNLFVGHQKKEGAPVVFETNPTYYNLFGKVERNIDHGVFYTDVTMIKAGAIHRANGGFLVLEAGDIFKTPQFWETLKRMLRSRSGFIEDMGEQMSMFPASGLRPLPVPLDLKVILVGTDDIYHTLLELDDEFHKLFKIKADFDYKMPRNAKNIKEVATFVASRCHNENLLHFDKSGFAALIEYSSRAAEDQMALTTQFSEIKDLLIESDYVARMAKAKYVNRSHVAKALAEQNNRVNLVQAHMMESVERKDILMTFKGATIGQVNGLTVYEMGDFVFGKPMRITCTTSVSDDGMVNIDRATKLSGNIHDKGLMILTGFLNALLANKHHLSLSASICFEQSYGLVDGDSATIAELVAVVSSMSQIAVKQDFAVTGSLNQFGEVQPVGGINEKIEGFLQSAKQLKSRNVLSVVLPIQNVSNLMLDQVTQKAVREGKLMLYPITHFWEAFELMTGKRFGAYSIHERKFAKGSALELISQRLEELDEDKNSEGKN